MAVFLCLTIILHYTLLKLNCQQDHHFLYFSRASLVPHMVKTLPAVQETWGQSLGQEDLLEEDMATHSSILAWRVPMDRGAWRATIHGITKSWTQLSNSACL